MEAKRMQRQSIIFALVAGISATPAYAASDVSPIYDGIYEGLATPVPWMSAPACTSHRFEDIRIRAGIVKLAATPARPGMAGFITEEGYLSAFMVLSDNRRFPMDGRQEDGAIVAGAIDDKSGCAWIVNLAKSK
jgi:hypothetical protein